MSYETLIHHHVRAETIEPTISQRIMRLGRPPQRWFHHALLLTAGQAQVADKDVKVSGPMLLLFAPSESESVALAAGAQGYLLGLSPELIGEAIGDHAESTALRLFSGAFVRLESLQAPLRSELEPLFRGAIAEVSDEGRASRMAVAAYARLILMAAWRAAAPVEAGPLALSGSGPILQRFRQLVETHFRQHWPITRYAEELGVSADRLHAICQRSLMRSPIELVHDRLAQEARLRLERSGRSVQDISDSLGFRDPANFSHFFKRKTGVSPLKYRTLSATSAGASSIPVSSDYSDWP